jgi:3-deoxy-D-manno-octulosonic-acid transferase
MYGLYSALLALTLLVSLPYWLIQMARHGKYRAGLAERLGKVPERLGSKDSRPTIWIHAVSVGEVIAIVGLASELLRRNQRLRTVVSTTTDTGQALAQKEFGVENVFYFPMDFGFAIRPYLRALRPRMLVLAETEFWPNILRLTKASGAPIAVVNSRISDRSWPRYQQFRFLLRRVLRNVDLFLAQTEEDARRLRDIGAPSEKVQVAGNLKFDAPIPPEPAIVARLRQSLENENAGPVLVCGSTVDGEEDLLLRAFEKVLARYPRAAMILAPRHPERFAAVARMLKQHGIRFWQRSLWNGEPLSSGVLLVDTIGELASLYGLGDIAVVGGSFVPAGGHNIIEAARHGMAILVGPYTENFRDIVRLFESRDAVRVASPAEPSSVLMDLLANEKTRIALGENAAETLRFATGATQRTADALERLLALAVAEGHSVPPSSDAPTVRVS